MRKLLIVFFTALLFAGINLPAQNPYIQHYTTIDGLPSNAVYQVYQDSKNFIWFATDAGVAKYDGSSFTYFRKHNGLSSNEVVRIKEDTHGRIWFFNLNATINYYYENTIYNETNAPFLASLKSKEFFRNFIEDEDKTLYFYYNYQSEIFSLDAHDKVRKYKLPSVFVSVDDFPDQPYESMIVRYIQKADSSGYYLWTAAGLFRLKSFGEQPKLVTDTLLFKDVFPVSKKCVYTQCGQRNSEFYEIRKHNLDDKFDTITPPIIPRTKFISSIKEDVNGYLWISTFDKGTHCYRDNKIIQHLDIKQGQSIIQDHENNIWISSMKDGVYKVSPFLNKHSQYNSGNFQKNAILAMCHHISNGIWFTDGRKVYLLQKDELFTSDFQSKESSFNQLLHVKDNKLLVGEMGMRQYALEGIRTGHSEKTVYFKEVAISPYPYKKFTLNRTGDQISTFDYFSLSLFNPDKLFRDMKTVFMDKRIFNTFYNSANELCINTKKNYLYKNDSLLTCETLSCFNDRIITGHSVLNDSTELFNIEGDSLYLLCNKKLFNLTTAFNYPIRLQIKHMDFHRSTLFFSTSRNLYLCKNPLDIILDRPIKLQPIDLSFRNINDIIFSDDKLYIASDDGLTAIPYAELKAIKTLSPIPYFKSIVINDMENETNSQEMSLIGRNRINIVFSSINYSSNPVIYSYKLEGSDDDWSSGTEKNVVYQNLSRGDYNFKLRVRKPTSQWSDPIEYRITIKATIWEHPLFYVVLSILIAGLFALFVVIRKNNQMKRQELDHQMVTLEQKALRSMMNPHFIFNALGSIQYFLLQNKPGEAGLYLSQFARLIRQNLSALNDLMVNLEEEVDRLKNYMDLERLRMENPFEYAVEFDEGIEEEDLMIPSMIIQPFVENAIWHGISGLKANGMIHIFFNQHDINTLHITIEDNGPGIKQTNTDTKRAEQHLNMGMTITKKRLEIIGKKMHVKTSIEISEAFPDKANPGTRVQIIVPVAYRGSKFR